MEDCELKQIRNQKMLRKAQEHTVLSLLIVVTKEREREKERKKERKRERKRERGKERKTRERKRERQEVAVDPKWRPRRSWSPCARPVRARSC